MTMLLKRLKKTENLEFEKIYFINYQFNENSKYFVFSHSNAWIYYYLWNRCVFIWIKEESINGSFKYHLFYFSDCKSNWVKIKYELRWNNKSPLSSLNSYLKNKKTIKRETIECSCELIWSSIWKKLCDIRLHFHLIGFIENR